MRNIFVASLLTLSVGIAGCSGSTGTAAAPEKTEESQAAYIMHGLVDQAMTSGGWIEQTAASPAVFKMHSESDQAVMTFSVTKADKCKYQVRIEEKGGPNDGSIVDLVKDFSGVDVDTAPPKRAHDAVASVPGLTGSCAATTGKPQACINYGADQTLLLFGFALDHERDAIRAFKAKFCQ